MPKNILPKSLNPLSRMLLARSKKVCAAAGIREVKAAKKRETKTKQKISWMHLLLHERSRQAQRYRNGDELAGRSISGHQKQHRDQGAQRFRWGRFSFRCSPRTILLEIFFFPPSSLVGALASGTRGKLCGMVVISGTGMIACGYNLVSRGYIFENLRDWPGKKY